MAKNSPDPLAAGHAYQGNAAESRKALAALSTAPLRLHACYVIASAAQANKQQEEIKQAVACEKAR